MRKYLILLILIIVLILATVCLPRNPGSASEVFFNIEKGHGSKEIALSMEKEGLIWWGPIFRAYVLVRGISGDLQAGIYSLSPSMSISVIAEKLARGDVAKETVTIIEGWNLRDIGFYFENKGMFQAEELWEIAGFPAINYLQVTDLPEPLDFSSDYQFLQAKPKNVGLEGYLFPDTYEINRGSSLEEIIRKMLNNFNKKLTPDLIEKISQQQKTIFEIVTMASLLEKEVKTFEDKAVVSGVLWKRLRAGVPLQVDATVTYITGQKSTRVSKEDTQINSPFNTYFYYGLPLGPICNPGLESIKAAIYPQDSPYWYYLSTPEGETIFSETLEDHNIAKAKYLK